MRTFPQWLKKDIQGSARVYETENVISSLSLHTICQESRCPNRGECFSKREATFLILGDICTRACGFCAVKTAKPLRLDAEEPRRVAKGIQKLGLRYAVITSVNRDDLDDGGASVFSQTVEETRVYAPRCMIELLVPDFMGCKNALHSVLDSSPECLSHNTETVPRLYGKVRPKSDYNRTLSLLQESKRYRPDVVTKSGIMAGLGEREEEVLSVMRALRKADCDILTIGQYLSPGKDYLPVHRFVHPDEFLNYERRALDMGFPVVVSSPFVRTSYRARESYELARERKGNYEQVA